MIKSAEQGFDGAQAYLGSYYCHNLKDYEKGVYWLQKAVDQKNPHAMHELGLCFLSGFGVCFLNL